MQGEQPGDGGYPVLMGAICRLNRVRAWSRGRAFLRGVAGSATMLAQGAAGEPQAGTPGPGAGGGEVPRLPGPDGRRVQHQPPVCAVMRLRTARPSVPSWTVPCSSCAGLHSGPARPRVRALSGQACSRILVRARCARPVAGSGIGQRHSRRNAGTHTANLQLSCTAACCSCALQCTRSPGRRQLLAALQHRELSGDPRHNHAERWARNTAGSELALLLRTLDSIAVW